MSACSLREARSTSNVTLPDDNTHSLIECTYANTSRSRLRHASALQHELEFGHPPLSRLVRQGLANDLREVVSTVPGQVPRRRIFGDKS